MQNSLWKREKRCPSVRVYIQVAANGELGTKLGKCFFQLKNLETMPEICNSIRYYKADCVV